MKTKIVLLPLDERPCNFLFPGKLYSHDDIEIVTPNRLGDKKIPADLEEIEENLIKEFKEDIGLVI